MEAEGIAAEVLFPDFGLPFELHAPTLATAKNVPPLTPEQRRAANRAYRRWLADFCSIAPHRFAGVMAVSWEDPNYAIREMSAAKASGLRGVLLPKYSRAKPLYHPDFDQVWSAIEDLDLVVHSHASLSSVTDEPIRTPGIPHPGSMYRLMSMRVAAECREILAHLIWGGVLKRHTKLRVALTEQGSGWVINFLAENDYAYSGGMIRPDVRDYLGMSPSEYFATYCYLGSSVFTRAEIEARHQIGVDKMMIGMDYPHQEGTLLEGSKNYLRATFGVVGVPLEEARRMLGETAAKVYGFDLDRLQEHAVPADEILSPPETDLYSWGDVHKPLF
jgi:predicted TIM-barrel fold metal-dependent hydrolase